MTPNPHKARWALRKAAELDRQLLALPQARDWRERARIARTAEWLRSEAARYRAMASRWAPEMAA